MSNLISNFALINEFIILIIVLIASIIDIKKKEIPDEISYVLGFFTIISVFLSKSSLITALIYALIAFLFGYILYIFGFWGGGDVKLMTALLIYFSNFGLFSIFAYLFLLALTGLLYNNILAIYYLPKLIFEKKVDKTISIIFLIFISSAILLKYWLFAVVCILFFDLYYLKIFEKNIMVVKRKTKDLTEGDWIITSIKDIPIRKTGLEIEDIQKLKKLKIKEVTIKDGFAFIPVIFLSFIFFLALNKYGYINVENFYYVIQHFIDVIF